MGSGLRTFPLPTPDSLPSSWPPVTAIPTFQETRTADDATMPYQLATAEHRLLDVMHAAGRGPKRNGAFALWLFVRQCDGHLPPDALGARGTAARLHQLERRLSSLSLPGPIRRALPTSLRELTSGQPTGIAVALQQLVAPAREAVGSRAAEALALAARTARDAVRGIPVGGPA